MAKANSFRQTLNNEISDNQSMKEDTILPYLKECPDDKQIETTTKKFNIIQQHSLDVETKKFPKLRKLRPNISSSNKRKTSLTYRYSAPFSKSTEFVVPPVFPKTCSVYDSNFSGGAFTDVQEDKKLIEAINRMRKWQTSKEVTDAVKQREKINEDTADLSDSGNSSLTDGFSSPMNSPGYANANDVKKTSSMNAEKTSEEPISADQPYGKNEHPRKNNRLPFFRQRATSANLSKKRMFESVKEKDENYENDEGILPNRLWTIGTTKGILWGTKLLRTLSAGGSGA